MNEQPKDMWEDGQEPADQTQSARPKNPDYHDPNTGLDFHNRGFIGSGYDQIIKPKPKFPIAPLLWTIAGLALLGGGYYVGTHWGSIAGQTPQSEEQPSTDSSTTQIDWSTTPQKVSKSYLPTGEEIFSDGPNYYKIGQITDGELEGFDLVLAKARPAGPSFYDSYYRFAVGPGKTYLLTDYSDDTYFDMPSGVEQKNGIHIAEFDFPEHITNPNSTTQTLRHNANYDNLWFADLANIKTAFQDEKWGTVYTDSITQTVPPSFSNTTPKGGFYIKSVDGTAKLYELTVPFLHPDNRVDVSWQAGGSATAEYIMTDVGGCGAGNVASVMPASLKQDLVQTGTAGKDAIYELKDSDHILLTTLYSQYSSFGPESGTIPGATGTAEFAKSHPLFFWQDSFGRLIKFINNKYLPAAECGKPVIYLYPEQKTKVRVEVSPQGGMLYSDPAYNKGWDVIADTTGAIKNLADGKTYPYLFWEGRGGLYQKPDKGWVVSQAEVEKTLDDKLGQYGLNTKEIADFKEYWLPRMQAAPYYFISFYGTDVMNNLAPLNITPKPDTVVRVLMDFTPLQAPTKVAPYPIHTLPRTGFTVIEWGGVIQ